MRTLLLYDSPHRNVERLARAMLPALEAVGPVDLRSAAVEHRIDLRHIDLLVIGGPTGTRGMTPRLHVALMPLSAGALRDTRVATFDTRTRVPLFISGSSARAAAVMLRRQGARFALPPESFFVTRDDPPTLEPDEEQRAATWARNLVAAIEADPVRG